MDQCFLETQNFLSVPLSSNQEKPYTEKLPRSAEMVIVWGVWVKQYSVSMGHLGCYLVTVVSGFFLLFFCFSTHSTLYSPLFLSSAKPL